MEKQLPTDRRPFRFRIGNTKWLTEEICRIETMATERIRSGVSHQSVQLGALALLKIELGAVIELSAEPKLR